MDGHAEADSHFSQFFGNSPKTRLIKMIQRHKTRGEEERYKETGKIDMKIHRKK
jgi:hypothetical protein